MVTVDPFPGALDALRYRVPQALYQLGEADLFGQTLQAVGPIPNFVIHPNRFAKGATKAGLLPSGWRALILSDETPVACVHIVASPAGETRSVNVRGAEPAHAFALALAAADTFAAGHNPRYRVRFVTAPGLFVTAVWLIGRQSFFFPTRTGPGPRLEPRLWDRRSFITLIRRREQARRPSLIADEAPAP